MSTARQLEQELSDGTVRARLYGPDDATRPVVFVHGLLSNGRLWDQVAENLAEHGVRSIVPDWPLGSHVLPMHPDADLTPRGVARVIVDFLAALDLDDVTLVGNDTGGAVCQYVLELDHSRIGRLVLTNADAFEMFEPPPFDAVRLLRYPLLLRTALLLGRSTWLRHSPLAYGLLLARGTDPDVTRSWVEPALRDSRVLRDAVKFIRAIDKDELLATSQRMHLFPKPVLLVWGAADRFFTLTLARRLCAEFPDAELIEVPGGRTFLPLNEPTTVADHILRRFYPSHQTAQP